jgi:formate hydrogenlyase subunit 3/multisubunit Na+/H+ antiporter MnhD subunit
MTAVALILTFLNFLLAAFLFRVNAGFTVPWVGFGLDFSVRIYSFNAFILLAASIFGFLTALYSASFMKGRKYAGLFYVLLLLSVLFVDGAVVADNLIVMLFFWEGLLATMFGMIAIGNNNAFKTATKAFIILGICDLCMMFGIILTGYLAGTMTISSIHLPLNTLGSIAYIFLMIGAISKAGSMPFHSWIPDAALDSPLPFMVIFPASLEKLLGIYFLTRISLDMFKLTTDSWVSVLLMTIGVLTIILAVMMALIQKNYKKLLSYHAISQVGYMMLGIGTAVPAGIIGGIFHMINHAMYKSCLFLTGGSVEKQTGTTDLEKLGGMGWKMPVTFTCFIIAAASISGVPPFNGFFSKELVYDGALERGWIFYFIAVLGSFFTAASFLKLGHAAFMGKAREENKNVKEAPWPMLIPMITIAAGCILFGLWNALPIHIIQPVLGAEFASRNFAGFPTNAFLIIATLVVLTLAVLNHIYGVKKNGSGLKAADHIHHAPGLSWTYDKAEKGIFDPYNIGMFFVGLITMVGWWIDRAIDWLYDVFITGTASVFSSVIRKAHNGSYVTYLGWSLVGAILAIYFMIR